MNLDCRNLDHRIAVSDPNSYFIIKGPQMTKYANYLYARNVPNIVLRFTA